MDELSNIAMAHYQASPDNLQKSARDFFKAMDQDGDDKIDKREFLEFMEEEGHMRMTNTDVFEQLDHDGNGTLDFREVMTVYYILKSGRPFCDRCRKFITSTYLTCLGCLDGPYGLSYYLCLKCYDDAHQRSDHLHDNVSRFVDNYLLLEMTKLKLAELSKRPESTPVMQNRPSLYNRSTTVHYPQTTYNNSQTNHHHINSYPSASNAINPPEPNAVVNPRRLSRRSESMPVMQNRPSLYNRSNTVHYPQATYNNSQNNHHHISVYVPASNAINPPEPNVVVNPRRQQWKVALEVLNVALSSAAIASSFCTIL